MATAGGSSSSSSLLRGPSPVALTEELRRQLALAAPLVGAGLLQFCLQSVSIMFAGHLGVLPLAAASVASSFVNVSAFSVLLGMATALDTFCGQAYGAKQYQMLSVHTQRAMFVLLIVCIPLALVCANTGCILAALGQDPEISREAGIYAQWLIPGLFGYGLLQCITRFLQTQNVVLPVVICSGVTLLLHIIMCWILVHVYNIGNKGAALATTISYWFNLLLLALYVKYSKDFKFSWTGLSREAFIDVFPYLQLAVPSALMVCLEYWAFEMVVLLAGLLPNPKLETSVLSISLNTMWMVYTIPSGFSSAVSIRVSNELGAGNPQAARLAVCVAAIVCITEGFTVFVITLLIRGVWGYLYSRNQQVVEYVSTMMLVVAISDFMDGIQCTLSGAARGCGWQKICSVINLLSYYAVGIPSALIFAFVLHTGGKGLWFGIICAMTVQITALIFMIIRTSWDEEAIKARNRIGESEPSTTLQHDRH